MFQSISRQVKLILTCLIELMLIISLSIVLLSIEQFGSGLEKKSIMSGLLPALLAASSIFAGLVATYLVTKIIAVRAERIARLPEIDELSKKLTQLRKVLARFTSGFFVNYKHFIHVLRTRPDYTWQNITTSFGYYRSETLNDFWQERYRTDMAVYLALNEIVNSDREEIGWAFSKSDHIHKRYSYEELINAFYISNELWDYFDNNWSDYGMNSKVDFQSHSLRSKFYTDPIYRNASKIDEKYKSAPIDRNFLSDLGSEFHDQHLPRLISLVGRNNENLSPYLVSLIINLGLIILGGVLIPLFILFIKVNEVVMVTFTSISMATVTMSFVFIVLNFVNGWKEETTVNDY